MTEPMDNARGWRAGIALALCGTFLAGAAGPGEAAAEDRNRTTPFAEEMQARWGSAPVRADDDAAPRSELGRTLRPLAEEAEPAIASFYAGRGHAPLWLDVSGAPARPARALVAALSEAGRHALPPQRYDAEGLAGRLAAAEARRDPREGAALELELSRAYLRYARDISSGLLEPRRIDSDLHVTPPRPDPRTLLERMSASTDPSATLAALPPSDPGYARLVERLEDYRALARNGGWGPEVDAGPTMKPDTRSDRVRTLRSRLAAMGDLRHTSAAPGADDDVRMAANEVVYDTPLAARSSEPELYDEVVEAAVRRFQERHGLNRDGLVGPATRGALNRDAAFRARQIAVNLERMRWLNKPLGERHVLVNLPDFSVKLVEDGETVFTSRTVVGKRRHPTPEFSDEMEHMVVNPTWYVPASIARNEILPKLRQDPGYLARRNMWITGVEDPWSIDWSQISPGEFPGQVRQGPGPGNALGDVKFMFPNDHAIYLHDTPQRHLFARDNRTYSHGCVRVQEPYEFARHLLEPQLDSPAETFERWRRSGRETYVHLDRHVPVHITYRTAWVGEDGEDRFRGDIYGRDEAVAAALERAGVKLVDG